jgi:ELWxxDGT repeat protein
VGARLVFSAFQPGIGWRLWSSDGTAAGTRLLQDIDPSPTADEFSYNWHHVFCVVGGKLFFNGTDPLHGSALWVTDGTASGTRLVRSAPVGAPGMEPISMTAFQGRLYYTSRTDNSTLWSSDGTDAGTRQYSALTHFDDFNTGVGGLLYRRGTTDGFSNGIWVTDGNPAHQTQLSTDLSATEFYVALGATVFMNPDAPGQYPYRPLATTTGTVASTGVLAPVSSEAPLVVGSRLFFTSAGTALWRSDGTATGTALVTTRIPAPITVGARGALALIARSTDLQRYGALWASDGTDAGTVALLSDTTIAVTAPIPATTALTTASADLALAGTAGDVVGIDHVAFAMSGATSGGGAATGTTSWTILPTVNVGVTQLTITATGTTGTTASSTVTVTRVAGGPVVAILAPTAAPTYSTATAAVTIAGTASGPATIVEVDYLLSGATTASGQASGTASWGISTLLAAGQTRVTVIARDATGITATSALTVTVSDLVPAEHPGATQPGLAYAYAEGAWTTVPDFATLAPAATGIAVQPDLTPRRRDTLYALRFTGYIAVPVDGTYTFSTTSDDGSTLAIGGTLVVDNDGKHAAQQRSGTIGLQAGLHAFAAGYFQGGGGETFSVAWAGPGFTAQAMPAAACSHALPPAGGILREYWTGVSGRTVASLTSWPAFPLAPSGTSLQTAFVAPSNWADTYGTRMRGYVTAPLSGSYTFWIAGDDQCELWLSPSTGLEQDKVLIATVPSATAPLAWDTFPQQRSATITLTAGQSYYVEALQKEAGGGDCLAVGWQLPDASFERPIPGARLVPALVGSARLQVGAGR